MIGIRHRIARWLIGRYVSLPERKGVWIVMRPDDDPAFVVIVEADKFRLRQQSRIPSFDEPVDWGASRTTGRFVGTTRSA